MTVKMTASRHEENPMKGWLLFFWSAATGIPLVDPVDDYLAMLAHRERHRKRQRKKMNPMRVSKRKR